MLLVALVSFVHAFTLMNPDESRWMSNPVDLVIEADGCGRSQTDLDALLDDALAVWNSVATSSLRLVRATSGAGIRIRCGGTGGALGLTDTSYGSGVISAAEITLDASALDEEIRYGSRTLDKDRSRLYQIDILAHEIGHAIGLGHAESRQALMHYAANPREYATLSQDDIDGVSYLYPRFEPATNLPFGCASIGQASPWGLLPLVAAAALAGWLRWARGLRARERASQARARRATPLQLPIRSRAERHRNSAGLA